MHIIGKVYCDYILSSYQFDGCSHHLPKPTLGGIANLIHKVPESLTGLTRSETDTLIALVSPQYKSEFLALANVCSFNVHTIDSISPIAFIVDSNSARTSYVANDKPIDLPDCVAHPSCALIYYADKIKLPLQFQADTIFADTAGSVSTELYFDLSLHSGNVIISISEEYLTADLLSFYLSRSYRVIAHHPASTTLYYKNYSETIINQSYIKKPLSTVTGLGDIFIYILATYYQNSFSLSQSVTLAQSAVSLLVS
jgi:hypothetical protein